MDKIYDKCCGIDVHKKLIVACFRCGKQQEVREFGATTRELLELADWLKEGGCEMVAMEKDSEKWRNMRKQPRLIRFYRTTDMIDDNVPRDLQEEMKKQNIIKGMIFSSSNFTSACQLFVENRPIELYGKDKLSALLSKVQL